MEKDKVVQRIYSKIEEIPTLSPMLQKIISTVASSTVDAHDLTEIISRDPSLTSKVLKVSNSAYYGFQKEVDNLDRAVALLGFNMIRSLAMSVGIIRTLPSRTGAVSFSRERLWIHCLAVATIMKEMAVRHGKKEESDALFIAGLLHDIGKVVLDQFFAEEYQQVLAESGCLESGSVCEAEKKYFGKDHGEVGSILLRRWNFPASICNLVELDHKAEIPEGVNAADVSILHIADILSKEAGMGVSESIAPSEIPAAETDALKMTDRELEDLRDFLSGTKEKIYAFYNSLR